MSKDLNPNQYKEAVKAIYDEALQAATALLKEKGEKCYIAFFDGKDQAEGIFMDDDGILVLLPIFGVGLNEEGRLCVGGMMSDNGYDNFPQAWTDAKELLPFSYPSIYRFVAEYIESTITKAEADEIAEEYWDGEDF